jgi:hypothetical protein
MNKLALVFLSAFLMSVSAFAANQNDTSCAGDGNKGGSHFGVTVSETENGLVATVTEITGEQRKDSVVPVIADSSEGMRVYRQVEPSRSEDLQNLVIRINFDETGSLHLDHSALGLQDVDAAITCSN